MNLMLENQEIENSETLFSVLKYYHLKPIDVWSQTERSSVILCSNEKGSKTCVLKIGTFRGFVKREAECLQTIKHPNIVKLESYCLSDINSYIIMERVKGICLVDILSKGGKMKESEASNVAKQIGNALLYMHSNGWIHRDVKPDNVIYDRKTGVAKLVDFEFSTEHSETRQLFSKRGTARYLSPEVWKGCYFGPEVDVWSFGVTIFVMIEAGFPFSGRDESSTNWKWFVPSSASNELLQLLEKMLNPNGEKRITMEEVLKSKWFRKNKNPFNFLKKKS